jgi:hypothetical protein
LAASPARASEKVKHDRISGGQRRAIDPTKPCKGFGDNTLWTITEGDRSATTFLLPSKY